MALQFKWWCVAAATLTAIVIVAAGSWREAEARSTSAAAADLHREAIVVDGAVHITNRVYWEGIDPWKAQETGLWDFARARQGGLDVVVEEVMVEDRFNNYNYAVKQACRLIETFHRMMDAHRDSVELALSGADVRRIVASGKTAVILALEGGPDMEGDLDVIRLFYRLGVRQIQFGAHNTTNAYADAARDEKKWGGITPHGREVIHEMNRLGILIDIAHASDAAQLAIIEASATPVFASHFGLRHFSDEARTMSDEALKAMAAKGGVVGIHEVARYLSQDYQDWVRSKLGPEGEALAPKPLLQSPTRDYGSYIATLDTQIRENQRRGFSRPWRQAQAELVAAGAPLPTVEAWTNQIDYAAKLVGDDHLGIGFDFLGDVAGIRGFDAAGYPKLTESMVARGYSASRIRKVLGGNYLRIFDRAKVVRPEPRSGGAE